VRTAASWAAAGRRLDLTPDFVNWLDQHQPGTGNAAPTPHTTAPHCENSTFAASLN